MPLQKRINKRWLRKPLAYTRERGDNLRIFMFILLECMPLHRIDTWDAIRQRYRRPKNTEAQNWHRRYAVKISNQLGGLGPPGGTQKNAFCVLRSSGCFAFRVLAQTPTHNKTHILQKLARSNGFDRNGHQIHDFLTES